MYTLVLVLVYLTAINLGLPDSLLGVSWPLLHSELGVNTSSLGIITLCVTGFSILMSFFSGKIIKALGHGKVIAFSVTLTGSALLAISFTSNLFFLILFSIPLGMGGGAIDAAMNDYVARNYSSRQMNFLHCFWGVGATAGPILMSALLAVSSWRWGYRIIAAVQAVSALILFLCMPLWNKSEKLRQLPLNAIFKEQRRGENENAQENGKASLETSGGKEELLEEHGTETDAVGGVKSGCSQNTQAEQGKKYQNDKKSQTLQEQNGLGCPKAQDAHSVQSDLGQIKGEKQDFLDGFNGKQEIKEEEDSATSSAKNKAAFRTNAFFAAFKQKGVVLSLFSFFFYCGIESSVGNWGATYLVSSASLTPQIAARVISFYYMGITAGRLLSAFVSDKTGDKPLITGGLLMLFCGVLLSAVFKNAAVNIAGYLLIGLGLAPIFPSMVHLTPSRFDKKYSADIIGYQIAFAGIGIGVLPPLTGFVLSVLSFTYFPYALALFCVVLTALQLILNKKTS